MTSARQQITEQRRLLVMAARALQVSNGRTPADDARVTRAIRAINQHLDSTPDTQEPKTPPTAAPTDAGDRGYWCRVTGGAHPTTKASR